jgi:hypothetical protein
MHLGELDQALPRVGIGGGCRLIVQETGHLQVLACAELHRSFYCTIFRHFRRNVT